MAAAGLKGIWGLEQLDRAGIATWKLGLLFITGGTMMSILLFLLFGNSISDPELLKVFSPETTFIIWTAYGLGIGLDLLVVVFIYRFIQSKTESSLAGDVKIIEMRKYLEPDVRIIIYSLLLAFTIVTLLNSQFGLTFSIGFFDVGRMIGGGYAVTFYSLILLHTLFASLLIMSIFTSSVYLTKVAREIYLDLLDIDRYACLCNIAVIGIIVTSLIYALFGTLAFLVQLPSFKQYVFLFASIVTVVFVPCFIIVSKPIWIMHKRIVKEKILERERIKEVIEGRKESLQNSILNKNAEKLSHGELLLYFMMIETIPEWPLGPHLHKLIFYVLLPPVTWILAAALDRILF